MRTCSAARCGPRSSTWPAPRKRRACRSPGAWTAPPRSCTSVPRLRPTRSFHPIRRSGPAGTPPGPSSELPSRRGSSPPMTAGWRSAREVSGWCSRQRPERLLLVAVGPVEVVQLLLDAFADIARDVLDLALDLVELAFAFELPVAGRAAHALLHLTLDVVQSALEVLLVHDASCTGKGGHRRSGRRSSDTSPGAARTCFRGGAPGPRWDPRCRRSARA